MRKVIQKHLAPALSHYTDILVDHAEGIHIHSVDGSRYLDFTSGIGVTNTGHCHPKVVDAVREQVGKLIHGQANIVYHQPMIDLIGELNQVVPKGLSGYFFANSGAEAIESAIKLARQSTGRTNVIVFQGGFHGRTVGTLSLTTSNTIYSAGYHPLMPGVYVAPFPDAYYYGWTAEETTAFCLRQLRHLLVTQTAPTDTAAMLLEPVLGEGGYVPLPPEFVKGVRELCDEHDILLIIDEIQSGFCRTGRWFAHQHFDVTPDIMVMAKGLASGFPLSGIAYRPELMQNAKPGSQGGTYGGNAVCCAAAVASIQVLREENLCDNSARMGQYLMNALLSLKADYSVIGDVRGLGLMVGIEFTGEDGKPATSTAKGIRERCLEKELILLTCGPYGNVIRWIPPLIVTQEQIDEAIEIFSGAVKDEVG